MRRATTSCGCPQAAAAQPGPPAAASPVARGGETTVTRTQYIVLRGPGQFCPWSLEAPPSARGILRTSDSAATVATTRAYRHARGAGRTPAGGTDGDTRPQRRRRSGRALRWVRGVGAANKNGKRFVITFASLCKPTSGHEPIATPSSPALRTATACTKPHLAPHQSRSELVIPAAFAGIGLDRLVVSVVLALELCRIALVLDFW